MNSKNPTNTNILNTHHMDGNGQEKQAMTLGKPFRGKRVSYAVWLCVSVSMSFHRVANDLR